MSTSSQRQLQGFLRRSALLLILALAELHAQARVLIADVGPGAGGRILRDVLQRPHRIVEPDTAWFVLRGDERIATSLVVLGRTAAISGSVDGDVVVVDGDLHLRPGGRVAGRAAAIGGAVYPSRTAVTLGGNYSFRDHTFQISRVPDGFRLEHRSLRQDATPQWLLPGFYGFRLPSYDRVNGASVAFGPSFSFAGARGEANLLATYRSDIGKIDPAIIVGLQLSERVRARADVQRGTFSNDDWIWSDFVNSLASIALGTDTRNYYRADRAALTLHRLWEGERSRLEPFIGAGMERAWSVGPAIGEQRGPWSILGKSDSLRMWRPNPAIDEGEINSVLAGSSLEWEPRDVTVRARTRGEMSLAAPGDGSSTQFTSDVEVSFPTFGVQEYSLDVHWVTTFGDTPPAQRFSYLGGSGTLSFFDLLEQGGDQLLLVDQRYSVPVMAMRFGKLGEPTLFLRHRIGGAGVGTLPSFEQQLGVGVELTLIRGEIQVDPANGDVRASVGLTISR